MALRRLDMLLTSCGARYVSRGQQDRTQFYPLFGLETVAFRVDND